MQVNLTMVKFAFWLNDNSAIQDASKNPVPKTYAWEKLNLVWRGPRIIFGTGPGSTSQRPWASDQIWHPGSDSVPTRVKSS